MSGVSGLAVGQIGDTVGRIGLYSDGSIRWGVGGATAADIGIQRSGANTAQLFVPGGGTPVLDGGNGTVQNVNSLTAVTGTFTNLVVSGYPVGNYNNPPTTGTLTGEYWTSGNYSTTGNLTCNHVRLHVGGTVTIGNPVTVNTELLGGGGLGTVTVGRPGTAAGNDLSGVGGSYAGQGGQNGIGGPLTVLASTYFLDNYLGGSGGGNGDTPASTGGGGGGGLYIESNGNISITANITANGGVGVVGGATTAAGGGAGGAIDIRSIGTVTISGAATLSAVGGAGGVGASFGGGGGGGGCIRVRGSTVTNSGTVTVAGGAGGASASPGLAGGSGYTDVASGIIGPRSN